MKYPNKIYVLEHRSENTFLGVSFFVVVVAASSIEVAKEYVRQQIGFIEEPTWLMNGCYPTIYNSTGNVPATIQAKILYNGNVHFRE